MKKDDDYKDFLEKCPTGTRVEFMVTEIIFCFCRQNLNELRNLKDEPTDQDLFNIINTWTKSIYVPKAP